MMNQPVNLSDHPIYQAVYDACCEVERLPPSEQCTKAVLAVSGLNALAEKLIADRNRLENELRKLELENIRRIKHLNRLGTWAQQDPTGPIVAEGVQAWVLSELKAALGGEYNETGWEPECLRGEKCDCGSRIRAAFPELEPSIGHDELDELIGLLRVARMQRDGIENEWRKAMESTKACHAVLAECDSELSAYGARRALSKHVAAHLAWKCRELYDPKKTG